MEKKLLLLFAAIAVLFSACVNDSQTVTIAPKPVYDSLKYVKLDSAAIESYLVAHPEITPVKDTLGVKYQVITEGTGAYPTLSSRITINYTGKLLNGSQFDTATGYSNTLGLLIDGWKIVFPHLRVGSKFLMIIPSGLAYRDAGTIAQIPANSVLVFNIDLLAAQ